MLINMYRGQGKGNQSQLRFTQHSKIGGGGDSFYSGLLNNMLGKRRVDTGQSQLRFDQHITHKKNWGGGCKRSQLRITQLFRLLLSTNLCPGIKGAGVAT